MEIYFQKDRRKERNVRGGFLPILLKNPRFPFFGEKVNPCLNLVA